MEPAKPYSEELREIFSGILILVVIGVLAIVLADAYDARNENQYTPKREPTVQDYERWEEQYQRYGNTDPDIEVNQQYGSR